MKESLERRHIHKRIAIFMAFIMLFTMLPMHTLQVYAKSNEAKILIWSTYILQTEIKKLYAPGLKDFISKDEVAGYAGVDSISVDLKVGTQDNPQHFMGTEDLSQYGLIIVLMPYESLTDTDVSALKNYVNAGGRVVLQGERDGFARYENKVLLDFAKQLGVTVQITINDDDMGNAIINKDSDIMGGKDLVGNELEYRAIGEITYSGDAQVIATTVNKKYPFIVDFPVQKGRITVMSDINWWHRRSNMLHTPAQLQSAQELWGKFLSNSAKNMEDVENGINPNVKHEHHYNYISQGNKILAYCDETQGASECEYYGRSNAIAVTLLANDAIYSGEAYSGITLEGIDTYNAITKSNLEKSQVSFYQVETERTTTGGIKLESAPKEKGHYYAEITSNGAKAVAAFSIKGLAHGITVENGWAEMADSKAEEDTIVTIKANPAPEGKVFDKWTSKDVTFADANSAETTFNMPDKDVTVTANYIDKQLIELKIENKPNKLSYYTGESFEQAGMIVKAYYNDGTIKDVTAQCSYSPKGGLTKANQEITVSYTEAEVTKVAVQSISVTDRPILTATLHFDSQGGSHVQDMEVPIKETVKMPITTRSAYKFEGWYTEPQGKGTLYTDSTSITTSTCLYAKWCKEIKETSPSTSSSSSSHSTQNTTAQNSSIVIIDKKRYNIGNQKVSGEETIFTVDQFEFTAKIKEAPSGSEVIMPITATTNIVKAQLNLQNVKDMADKFILLKIENQKAVYTVPTSAIDVAKVSKALGQDSLKDIQVEMIFEKTTQETIDQLEKHIKDQYTMINVPMTFEIQAMVNGKAIKLDTFNTYVARNTEVTAKEAEGITTAVIIGKDGRMYHIPTNVYQEDNKYFVQVNSLVGENYILIENKVNYSDAAGKWYEEVANELGSRMITKCLEEGNAIQGDKAITRAEFAALLVNALGLPQAPEGADCFKDVAKSSSYLGEIGAAYQYEIIKGVSKDQFAPNKTITREEAMAMMQRAAKVAQLKGEKGQLEAFEDYSKVSEWAKDAVAFNIGSDLIIGSNNKLRPQSTITRAESMTVVLRMLQKADLIDIRVEV